MNNRVWILHILNSCLRAANANRRKLIPKDPLAGAATGPARRDQRQRLIDQTSGDLRRRLGQALTVGRLPRCRSGHAVCWPYVAPNPNGSDQRA